MNAENGMWTLVNLVENIRAPLNSLVSLEAHAFFIFDEADRGNMSFRAAFYDQQNKLAQASPEQIVDVIQSGNARMKLAGLLLPAAAGRYGVHVEWRKGQEAWNVSSGAWRVTVAEPPPAVSATVKPDPTTH
ncbi:MAG: hypothetical protein ACYC9P_03365 [Rudaea sp.]